MQFFQCPHPWCVIPECCKDEDSMMLCERQMTRRDDMEVITEIALFAESMRGQYPSEAIAEALRDLVTDVIEPLLVEQDD